MLKIDLHTHSTASLDGGIKPEQYKKIIDDGTLDYVAITDHNNVTLAKRLHGSLGDHIIVGQEIVKPRQTALATAKAIKAQGGLVYIPHPFETIRSGVTQATLESLAPLVDIIEVHNGRALFQNRGPETITWARLHQIPMAASSDAHGYKGLGTVYTLVAEAPSRNNLAGLLTPARFSTNRPPLRTLLYPKMHRLRKKVSGR